MKVCKVKVQSQDFVLPFSTVFYTHTVEFNYANIQADHLSIHMYMTGTSLDTEGSNNTYYQY